MSTKWISLALAAVALLVLVGGAQAQGVFVPNGFGIEASVASQEHVTTLGAEAGYVWNGLAEAGLSAARATDDQNGLDLNALAFTPFVGVYPLRQSGDMPVSLRLGASYSFFSFSGDYVDQFDELGLEIDGHSYEVNGQLFRAFSLSPTMRIIPRVGLSYVWATLDFKGTPTGGLDNPAVDESDTNSFEVVTLGTSFAFGMRRGSVVTLTPRLTIADGETGFGVSTGFILPRR